MSQYQAPLHDIDFLTTAVFPLDPHLQRCGSALDAGLARSVVLEAGKFAQGLLDPLNRIGDQQGCRLHEGGVSTPVGFQQAYRAFCEGGWNGLRQPEQYGGQGLSCVLSTLTEEIWHACNPSFALCAMLTGGAIETLLHAASPALKDQLLPRLISGEWTGTMNLTEPAAGSDLGAVRTRAIPLEDGSYAISGQKIFITYGDHDLASNIIHLVLARTPDAPSGAKGLSLFAVPKYLIQDGGSPGARNDVHCTALEHKLGIHASPTAVMQFGAGQGATGYLVGELNQGLMHMFVMMNEARCAVGNQGLAVAERAFQHAVWYARERSQGKVVGEEGAALPILRHPDVRRLLLSMKTRIESMRALGMYLSMQRDLAHAGADLEVRSRAQARVDLLIPVMKGWFTETAQRITYDAVQVFGGMGFIEETGAAQYYRDARILTIYEGTTAIQANDLLGRKTIRDGGAQATLLLDEMSHLAEAMLAGAAPAREFGRSLRQGCAHLREAIAWLLERHAADPRATHAGAVSYLELWGLVAGAWMQGLRLRAALDGGADGAALQAIQASAQFYAGNLLVQSGALRQAISTGGSSIDAFPDACWST
ncbi:acyl-CoA dehydrogenase [Achromobacter sp. SD115]|uniref:acyl-CoA dehydrogenase n=1 Tax=Achromobacter sp. SD115 TaxID=2782011 RepID=UPI001A97486F|nr:acyl-CoA dehydrogenase [Achromobacter sp. SD115]MBO1015482.1 acyl-CoA dehydrogenase [Achromobacter sp. SD115]